jgi:hypothetical protein
MRVRSRRVRPGPTLDEFVVRGLAEKLTGEDVFRVTLTSFLDAHTFDTRAAMKCCLAHALPSGHVVPFCTYNMLYRDGHVPLPPLADQHRHPRPRPKFAAELGARIALGLAD